MAVELSESRKKIDEIDRQIAALFEERMKVSGEVAEYKISTGKQVLDKEREKQKLETVAELVEGEFNKTGIRELYSQIMSISRKYQYTLLSKNMKSPVEEDYSFHQELPMDTNEVAFYGVHGTYTEQAMEEFFGKDIKGIPCASFKDVMQAVKDGKTEYGVLPIENSSTGSISDIYDLLVEYDNRIVGEHVVKIEHVLMGVPGSTLSDITDVYSHTQPLMQCKNWLSEHPEWKQHTHGSTAESAQKIITEQKKNQAAIASKRAAQYYGLEVLAENISMSETNSTRFIVISRKNAYRADSDKISICFEIPHVSGSLYSILSHFIFNNLNMTNIESRPIAEHNWEYRFFLDFEGKLSDPAVKNALTGIRAEANSLVVLGNYHTADIK